MCVCRYIYRHIFTYLHIYEYVSRKKEVTEVKTELERHADQDKNDSFTFVFSEGPTIELNVTKKKKSNFSHLELVAHLQFLVLFCVPRILNSWKYL